MGKRFLKENLLNPISQENKSLILKRYEMIDGLLQESLFKKLKEDLKCIYDMERLHRRMAMGILTPYELYRLDIFYQASSRIISILKKKDRFKDILSKDILQDFFAYQVKYNNSFDFENYNLTIISVKSIIFF